MTEPIKASDVETEDIKFLAPDIFGERFPMGMLTVVAGKPDQGKGLLAVHVAAAVSAAGGKVLYSAAEDSHGGMTVPRLEAAGANMDNVFLWRFRLAKPGHPADQLAELATHIRARKIDLVVIDPLASHLTGGISRHSDNIREVLNPLTKILEETGCTVLIIEHALKGSRKSGHPLDMIGGSGSGLPAATRAAYVFGSDPDDRDKKILAPAKFNVGPLPKALEFEIDTAELDGLERPVPFLLLNEELTAFDPMRLFDKPKPTTTPTIGRPPDKRAAAAEWLTTYLADAGKPVKASTITEDAKQYGMSQKTLRRAADDMGIVKSAKGGPNVTWDLPQEVKDLMGLGEDDEGEDVTEDAPEGDGISLEDGLNALLGGDDA